MPCLEITTIIGCRNNCTYCPQDKLINAYRSRSKEMLMSFDTFKRCIDKVPKNIVIELSGFSEAWLNPECTNMVRYASQKGHKISIYTTLVGMTLADLDLIKEIPIQSFWLHLPTNEGKEKIIVDGNYLKLLKEVSNFLEANKDKINISYHIRGREAHPKVKAILRDRVQKRVIGSRAGNLNELEVRHLKRRRGEIGCARNLCQNVLLPNGDVALCCMDYGLKHIIGNLLTSGYQSLFSSNEFLKVKKGLEDESIDTLCRYCDMLAYNKDWKAKIYNSLDNIRNWQDLCHLLIKVLKIK